MLDRTLGQKWSTRFTGCPKRYYKKVPNDYLHHQIIFSYDSSKIQFNKQIAKLFNNTLKKIKQYFTDVMTDNNCLVLRSTTEYV